MPTTTKAFTVSSVKERYRLEKFRARNFNMVLYSEDETHKRAMEYITKNYDYAMILHDKDISEETGELKKEHYHIVVRFNNAKWNTSLSEELGITPNYIEESKSLKRSLLYLIHYYDEDKHRYDISEVKGSLQKKLKEYINNDDKCEWEKVDEIFQFIDEQEILNKSYLMRYCTSIGYWDILRRNYHPIMDYLTEHNNNIV